jgi:GTP cyclohydrolase II
MGFESVRKVAEAEFPTRWGDFRIFGFEGLLPAPRPDCEPVPRVGSTVEGLVALVMGDIHSAPPLVRIHSQCLTGDVFGSLRCDCELPAEVLKQLGVSRVRLMTNNPAKVAALESAGIAVVERVSAEVESQESFERYLKTKQEKMGHIQDLNQDSLVTEEHAS